MNTVIKSLNLTEGAVLTLEKFEDRMEFEAIAIRSGSLPPCSEDDLCGLYINCTVCLDENCHPRYFDCSPYTTCDSNDCRPVK